MTDAKNENGYDAISSVWEGSDADLLSLMLPFYHSHHPDVLDCNYGGGRFWRGSPHR